jgi:hypothetical protein
MDDRDRPAALVREQKRHAIGRQDTESDPGLVGHEGVRLGAGEKGGHAQHTSRVDLAGAEKTANPGLV